MKYIIHTHTHTVYLLHVSATHVAIFRERRYEGQIRRHSTEVSEPMHIYIYIYINILYFRDNDIKIKHFYL